MNRLRVNWRGGKLKESREKSPEPSPWIWTDGRRRYLWLMFIYEQKD